VKIHSEIAGWIFTDSFTVRSRADEKTLFIRLIRVIRVPFFGKKDVSLMEFIAEKYR
jgi:hypothetical protein